MSDLVTTAIATGGTSFDTATCIGGHKQDPFKIYGSTGVIYEHDMVQTKTEYQSLELNSTMEAYDATNAPNGYKPTRSPFADDADAYFVGDTNFQDAGNGLVRFKRIFSRIPNDYEIPYGLYSRTMPQISAHSETTTLTTGFDTANSFIGVIYTNTTSEAESDTFFINNIDDSNVVRHKLTLTQLSNGYSYTFKNPDNVRVGLTNGTNVVPNSNTKFRYVFKGVWDSGFNGNAKNDIDEGLTFGFILNGNFHLTAGSQNSQQSYNNYYLTRQLSSLRVVSHDSNGFIATSNASFTDIGTAVSNGFTWLEKFCWGNTDLFHDTNFSRLVPFEADGFSAISSVSSGGGTSRSEPTDENMPAKVSYRFVKTDSLDGLNLANKYILPDNITASSDPTRGEYLDLVNDGTFVASEVEFLERYLGNIYKIGQIKTQLK